MTIKSKHALWGFLGGGAVALLIVAFFLGRSFPQEPKPVPAVPIVATDSDHHDEEGAVAMDAARVQSAGIELVTVTPGSLGSEIIAQATINATPQGQASVAARADGAVTRIVVHLGDHVRAGQTLALLESREASTIAAERSSAQAKAVAARAAFAREKRLFEAKITAREGLEAAQSALSEAEAELRRTNAAMAAARVTGDGRSVAVSSPISGRVTGLTVSLGAYVTAGTELFRVADPGLIQVEAAVPIQEARRIAVGDPAELETPAGRVAATVRSIAPAADPESRAVTVVLTPHGTGLLSPGQSVRVRITPSVAGADASAIVLPEEAVQTVEGRDVVFVRTATGFKATPVTVGSRSGGRVEIRAGLNANAVVAGRNAFLLKSELGKSEAEH